MQLAHCLSSGHVDTHRDDYEESRNVWIGLLYILLGFISISCNLIVLSAITRHPLNVHACFKLLTVVVFFDLLNLILLTFVSGTLSLLDANHCNSGIWITTVGYVMSFTWCAYSAAAEILAFNRLLEFGNKRLCSFLFYGRRCWIWTPLPLIYFVALNYFKQPSFYYYDPYGGGWEFFVDDNNNPNFMFFINNFFKFGLLIILYSTALFFMYKRTHENPEHENRLERSVALQSLSVAILTNAMTIAYICLQYLPASSLRHAPMLGHLTWIVANSATSFVYLMANRSVKRKLGRMMGMAEEIIHVQQLSANSASASH